MLFLCCPSDLGQRIANGCSTTAGVLLTEELRKNVSVNCVCFRHESISGRRFVYPSVQLKINPYIP